MHHLRCLSRSRTPSRAGSILARPRLARHRHLDLVLLQGLQGCIRRLRVQQAAEVRPEVHRHLGALLVLVQHRLDACPDTITMRLAPYRAGLSRCWHFAARQVSLCALGCESKRCAGMGCFLPVDPAWAVWAVSTQFCLMLDRIQLKLVLHWRWLREQGGKSSHQP